jgi:glycine hydroxymethyltransferase
VLEIVERQNTWRGSETVNLIASENVMSPLARRVLSSDFWHRYAEGTVGNRGYQGTRFIDEVEQICIDLFRELYKVRNVDVRPISGAVANLAVYYALTKPGDTIMSLSVPNGAHISYSEFGSAGYRGLTVSHIPFDPVEMNVNLNALFNTVSSIKPKLLMLGGSVILFPLPVKEIRKMADEVGSMVVYDGAHVMGFIGCESFQDPLAEGANVLSGSTHKTLPGPQGGVVMANDDLTFERLEKAVYPGLVSNHHLHRLPALAITLLEMKMFGKEYTNQMVKNAKMLGKALYEHGFNVLCAHKGFTESHQIVVDVSKLGGGKKVAERLEESNIIINKNLLPRDDLRVVENPSGIRLGVQEVTRFEMGEEEMEVIAEFIKRVCLDKEDPHKIKEEVITFRKGFLDVGYCF